MSSRDAKTERQSPSRWSRAFAPAALVLATVLAIVLATALFTTAVSRADGPPNLSGAFTLPFKLEQGRPAPARASSVPRQVTPPPAETLGATPVPAKPDAPTNVNAYPIAYSVIEIEWSRPSGEVDGFEVEVSPDGSDDSWSLLAGKSSLTDPAGRLYTWTQQYGLQVYQTRYYRVRASNGEDNWGEWSETTDKSFATTYSTSGPSLTVEALGKNDLKISWEGPSAARPIEGWRLEVTADAPPRETVSVEIPIGSPGPYLVRPPRTQNTQRWALLEELAAGERSFTHSGLNAGDTRYYRVQAKTDVGTPAWSVVSHARTNLGALPAAPVLTGRANGATEIVLAWTKPDDRGFPITTYLIEHSPDGRSWSHLDYGGDELKAYIFIDEPGTTRHYRIRSRSVSGDGPWSRAVRVTTENGGAGAPTGLRVVDSGDTWVEIAWDRAQKGSSEITGYQVQRAAEGNIHHYTNVGRTGRSPLTLRDTGLKPATHYQYRVAARDSGGLGPWGTEFSLVRTELPLPPALRLTARAKERDTGAHRSADSRYRVWIELTWPEPKVVSDVPGVAISHYLLERSPNGETGWKAGFDGPSYRPTDLDDSLGYAQDLDVGYGETWYYRIRDHNNAGHGPWSNKASATTRAVPPSVLNFLRADAEEESHIEISWMPPDRDGGSDVTGYQIQASTKGHGSGANYSTVATLPASPRTYTHKGLKPETRYCYRYRARNSAGWSDWQWGPGAGKDHCFRTTPALPATPSISVKATTFTVDGSDIRGVKVSWTQPAKKGVTVTGFEVSLSHDGLTWIDGATPAAADRSFTISYLDVRVAFLRIENLTKAYFRVGALSANGPGDWSQKRSITIPKIDE